MRPAIVIFGAAVRPDGSPSRAMIGRVEAALALGEGLCAPLYVPTGGQGRFGRPEAVVMAAMLEAAGVAREAILVEPTARDTFRSALACAALLPRGTPVLVATSGYHMARCVLLLRLAGMRARAGRSAAGSASARWRKRWFWRMREMAALPWDAALMVLARWRGDVNSA